MTILKKIRVRYAPSPTGHLHIGNARTALFNYLFAKHVNGTFILRTEDTDGKRNIVDGEKSQIEYLHWLGITWDEGPDIGGSYGPYRQSENFQRYKAIISQLLKSGLAYKSYKTEEELEQERANQIKNHVSPHYVYEYEGMSVVEIEANDKLMARNHVPYAVRFRIPDDCKLAWNDLVKGHMSFDSSMIGGDFIIQKRDGMPTYNFAVVVDDHDMQISHVLRGDDHVSNTPKQIAIYNALGWSQPVFGHMSLIINPDTGKKLSKRDETKLQFLEQYKYYGYLPDAIFNFISLLGWSPQSNQEILSKKELVKIFDTGRLSKSAAGFDQEKLDWINHSYIKKMNVDQFKSITESFIESDTYLSSVMSEENLASMLSMAVIFKSHVVNFFDLLKKLKMVYDSDLCVDNIYKYYPDACILAIDLLREHRSELSIKKMVGFLDKYECLTISDKWQIFRLLLTGAKHGPDLTLILKEFDNQLLNIKLNNLKSKFRSKPLANE
ncbi:glutamate--tRNA ligase [Lactiplantibacillus paraplantarum]|uniref:glutamate--tRNA ligase n=1 Tax=Lactiplantibacillus paraplantarum TaxID=60520 RepID=UPI0007FE988F|nr:glutamate--tRNA ligase [Lactiplantibacillus paraplantarum]OAX76468.1 hypothetical protein A0U96_14095 [Lactiplantibacillus plantarum]RDG12462.1 glutamate--tRNA ligase [Lactiplantibacillus paraplantarum]